MNARQAWCIAALGAIATPLHASITMSIDILDASDPGGPAPAGMVIVDVGVDVSADDYLFSAGIYGETHNGASILYGESQDPNNPGHSVLPPGVNNRFVTFGSAAFGRDDPPRFAPAGTIAKQTISPTSYFLPGPLAALYPNWIDFGFWAYPIVPPGDPSAPRGRDGFVFRLALDVNSVSIPGAGDPANYRICELGMEPSGYDPVFTSGMGHPSMHGTGVWSNLQGEQVGQDWGLYVPEPTSGALLLLPWVLRLGKGRA